jgi:hypothetical protein
MQKIFRAMQKHGLIVADNGSDLYITGTFDTRWNNDILNPAFALLSASDFEVVQLGWNPVGATASLSGVTVSPSSVTGGAGATGTVALSAPAPAAGAQVTLSSNQPAVLVPVSVGIGAGATSATFPITTHTVASTTTANVTASYAGVGKSASLTLQPAATASLATLALQPSKVVGGARATGSVALTAAAPTGGLIVALASSNGSLATVPASVTIAGGASSATFSVDTAPTRKNRSVTITASTPSRTLTANLTVCR